jgi:hypothetical protein
MPQPVNPAISALQQCMLGFGRGPHLKYVITSRFLGSLRMLAVMPWRLSPLTPWQGGPPTMMSTCPLSGMPPRRRSYAQAKAMQVSVEAQQSSIGVKHHTSAPANAVSRCDCICVQSLLQGCGHVHVFTHGRHAVPKFTYGALPKDRVKQRASSSCCSGG